MAESAAAGIAVCDQCDWVMRIPPLPRGGSALCPRCGHQICRNQNHSGQRTLAWTFTTLILLFFSLPFEFIRFESRGIEHSIALLDTAGGLLTSGYSVLALLVLLTTVLLPLFYLMALACLQLGVLLKRSFTGQHTLALWLTPIEPWMMTDVFVIGVLVSLIKIVSMAEISLGPAFFLFVAYSLALMVTVNSTDRKKLWDHFLGPPEPVAAEPGRTAAEQGIALCHACRALFRDAGDHRCTRCGYHHPGRSIDRRQFTWALLLTAAILYIPANAYPIMQVVKFGESSPSTIIGGVLQLIESGSWPIALIIFLASIVIPIAKVLALGWLTWKSGGHRGSQHSATMRLYRVTELIGRWSMIDVFVVAVLVALIHAGELMSIYPGPAAMSFAGVVIITMVAAITFDPRSLWRNDGA
ncbi:paraquat-inducible protein A [Marinobacteraceae bacterium S3BR75-40.1]